MDASAALRYLNSWGLSGVQSGKTEFWCHENRDRIIASTVAKAEPISRDQFLQAYQNWDFRKIDCDDYAQNAAL